MDMYVDRNMNNTDLLASGRGKSRQPLAALGVASEWRT